MEFLLNLPVAYYIGIGLGLFIIFGIFTSAWSELKKEVSKKDYKRLKIIEKIFQFLIAIIIFGILIHFKIIQ